MIMAIERHRRRFNFWLDTHKPDDRELAEAIDELKEKRQFMKSLRQAFTLLLSLRSHDTSVLLSLFPWVSEELATQTEHIGRLETLVHQFQTVMTSPRLDQGVWFSSGQLPENIEAPLVVVDEQARKELVIKNTLAQLDDF